MDNHHSVFPDRRPDNDITLRQNRTDRSVLSVPDFRRRTSVVSRYE